MNFRGLTFSQFGLLFGAMAAALLLIYVLRYRRRGRVISSTLIWKRVVGAKRSIWSEVLAYLLHLLMLGLIAFALTDPAPATSAIQRRYVAVVIDSSFSMGAAVGEKTRMDLAAEEAWNMLASLRQVDRAMIVAAGTQVRALTGMTNNPDVLKAALEGIRPAGRAPRLAEAARYVQNAFALLDVNPGDGKHLFVFTDRPDTAALPLLEGIDAKVVGVGTPAQNTGIVAFDVRKPFNMTGGHELMVRVANFGDATSRSRLVVYTPDATVGKLALELAPGQQETRHYYLPFGVQGKVTALLQEVTYEVGADAMLADNAAFANVPRQQKSRVLLVTDRNLFLRKALSLNPQVALNQVPPDAYTHAMSYGYDTVLFDNYTPPKPPPTHAVYIHPTAAPFQVGDEVDKPALTGWMDEHQIVRYIKLNDLEIKRAHPIVVQKGDTVVAEHFKHAMIVVRRIGARKIVGIGFNLKESDLPLRVAFPVFFHNVISWFAETDDAEQRTTHRVGDPLRLPVLGDPASVELTDPRGRNITLTPRAGYATYVPESPGFYSYQNQDREKTLAVSLADAQESDLSGARSDPVPPFAAVVGKASTETFWPFLILLVFALVVIDFWLYNDGKLP